ncbi:MAG: ABC transporter permease [Acholeplasmataceae bacterium]|jgi:ABC-2 type transport system permease protein
MKKFRFLLKHNLKKLIWTKGFLISNIIIFIIMVVLINLPNIINRFDSKVEDVEVLIYFDDLSSNNDEEITNYLNQNLTKEKLTLMGFEDVTINLVYSDMALTDDKLDQVVKNFRETDSVSLIRFVNTTDYNNLVAENYDNHASSRITGALSSVISRAVIDINNINVKYVEIIEFAVPGDEDISEQRMIQMNIINLIVSIPMLMIIIRALVFVGVDIVQEKSSKAIETIISSVPARSHFFSKVLASLGFVVIQCILMLIFGVIGSLFSGQQSFSQVLTFIDVDPAELTAFLLVTLVFTVLSSLLYLIIGGLLAAMSNSQEDYQTFQTPITLIILLGFYMNMFLFNFGQTGLNILKVFSFIPPLSGFIAPFAFAIGVLNWWETLIAFLVFGIVLFLVLYFFEPVYRVSILSYEKTKFFKRIASNFKKARLERKGKK